MTAHEDIAYVPSEGRARRDIDSQLTAAGWAVQGNKNVNLAAAQGVAVREFVLEPPHGRVDYLLFVDGKPAGVIEAKPRDPLVEVERQSAKYVEGLPDWMPKPDVDPLPFVYESTGAETRFTNAFDPEPASRQVFTFHRPETLAEWVRQVVRAAPSDRRSASASAAMPPLHRTGLWAAQETAIRNLEESFAQDRPRALIQMATGSGKTFTAANVCYRLIKHADARRVLFLVDRANLGRRPSRSSQASPRPTTGASSPSLQRPAPADEHDRPAVAGRHLHHPALVLHPARRARDWTRSSTSLAFELEPTRARSPVAYNPKLPIETFDVDHRRRVPPLDLRGVAPGARLLRRLHHRADRDAGQADLRLLQPEPGDGVHPRAGRRRRRQRRLRRVPDRDRDHRGRARRSTRASSPGSATARPASFAWRSSTTTSTTTPRSARPQRSSPRTRSAPSSEPSGTALHRDLPRPDHVPKTLIFAKDDSHADDIVQMVREEFGKGNDFAAKITYKATDGKARGPARGVPQLLQPAHRGHRRHDRHGHRRQARWSVVFFMRIGQDPHLLRADEGPRRPDHQPDRPPGGTPTTPRSRTAS